MSYLNLDQIAQIAPSVINQDHSPKLSGIYKHIPTTDVIDILGKNGWGVTKVLQSNTRKGNEGNIPYKKHMLRFRNMNDTISKEIGDTFPEIVMTNSHDGTSSFKFHVGLFRLVCSNGLVIADQTFSNLKINHKGFEKSKIIEIINETTVRVPDVVGKVQKMMGKEMSMTQQYDFAMDAYVNNWGLNEDDVVDVNQLLKIRRDEDRGNDLWSVFNRVQENIVKGGVLTIKPKGEGKFRRSRSRVIKSIDKNIQVNKMLWSLSESLI